jgi:RNA 2',3'-cyclic 3'-phosphodiesterase
VTERPERARLFVALDLPEGARAALAGWAVEVARPVDGLRLVDTEMLHVTLVFLGWREVGEAERIGDLALAEAEAAAVPALAVEGAAWLPPRRPRVLAVDLADGGGALAALQSRVSASLTRSAGFEPERRAFRPHVTVARVRKEARVRAGDLPVPPALEFPGDALTLYRSRLTRTGAVYEPLARAALG